MKIILASYFEPENHGSGRKIGISPGKPKNLSYECELVYEALAPDDKTYWSYQNTKKTNPDKAAEEFTKEYNKKLSDLVEYVREEAKNQKIKNNDILKLEEEDTLLSWENKGNASYREILATYLEDLGYEVIKN